MDRVADAIIRIKNAQRVKHDKVTVLPNRVVMRMCEILRESGYIDGLNVVEVGKKKTLELTLKYDKFGNPVITEFKKISKDSRRVYESCENIPRIANGYATVVVSTSKGIMTGKEARESGVGGEVVAYVL